jgi:hypothetical protein
MDPPYQEQAGRFRRLAARRSSHVELANCTICPETKSRPAVSESGSELTVDLGRYPKGIEKRQTEILDLEVCLLHGRQTLMPLVDREVKLTAELIMTTLLAADAAHVAVQFDFGLSPELGTMDTRL